MNSLTADAASSVQPLRPPDNRWYEPAKDRYLTLALIDREHAASLAQSCRLSDEASRVSRVLANHSLLQCILTSIPLIAADFITMWTLLFASTAVVERLFGIPTTLVTRHTALVASLLLAPIARLKGMYPAIGISPPVEFREIVQSTATALCIFSGIGIVASPANWPYFMISTFLTLLLAIPIFPAVRYAVRELAARCRWWGAPVLIYAKVDAARELFSRLRFLRQCGLRPVGVLLSSDDYWASGVELDRQNIPAYDVRHLLHRALEFKATWVLVGANQPNPENESEIQADLNAIPNRVMLTTGGFNCGMWDRTHTIGPVSGLWLSGSRHCYTQAVIKRFVDLAVTSVVAMVFSPLILTIAIAIRLSSPGPVFYSQKRLGRGGQIFWAWKFRSMVPDADRVLQEVLDSDPILRREWEQTHKLKRDPRITSVGRLIRATSLDELPQLWNILRGDMGLVGPRPIVDSPAYDAAYVHGYPSEFATYCSVRPGLTGLWQVTCRNSGVYEMRIYWDMYYIRNWSLWLDLYIILRTIRTVLLREGAY